MILYICDGTGECKHTTDPAHALHKDNKSTKFIPRPGRHKGEVNLWESDDAQ